MIAWLKGKKTYIVSSLLAAASLIHLITGEMTIAEFIMSNDVVTLIEAAGFSTLRAGITKNS